MMSRHFALNSELTGAIAKRLPHAKNQLSEPGSFFNQFVTEIYIYTNNNRVLIVRGGALPGRKKMTSGKGTIHNFRKDGC